MIIEFPTQQKNLDLTRCGFLTTDVLLERFQVENTILQGGDNSRLKELKAEINVLLERKAPM